MPIKVLASGVTVHISPTNEGETHVPNATLAEDIEQVKRVRGVLQSALLFIQGEAARLRAGIEAALAAGATAEELAVLSTEVDAMEAEANNIANAIATPGPTQPA